MLKKFKCISCGLIEDVVTESMGIKIRVKVKNGVLVDYFTEKPIVDKQGICTKCGGSTSIVIDGVPHTNFPIDDLDFSISKKRMAEGLYCDMSSKQKKKSKELKEEMNHTSEKVFQ